MLAQYLEGRPLSKIRDVDKKKKILKVFIGLYLLCFNGLIVPLKLLHSVFNL